MSGLTSARTSCAVSTAARTTSPNNIYGNAEAGVAVTIRGADLNQRYVDAHAPAPDELRNVGKEHRHEIRSALLHRISNVGANEEGDVPKAIL